jgi:probable HAF family extracellular repeat protein
MRTPSLAVVLAAVCACTDDVQVTQPRAALAGSLAIPAYTVAPLGTLGGNSQGGGINAAGWVAGYSGLPDGTRHAALWRNGAVLDLGTLGGAVRGLHSNVQWPGLNNGNMVVGISHTTKLDTLGETWSCAAFMAYIGHICRGFAWQGGTMTAMPTLGGENSFAAGVNVQGQVAGWAETAVHDGTCVTPQVLQFRAVVWEPRNGQLRQLPPFPGDATSAATAINDDGVAVGISGDCDVAVGRRSARHAVLWDGATITDLGSLGGDYWHTPMAINDSGVVVGFSNPPGGDLEGNNFRAFVWTRAGGMKDLGLLSGDAFSQALGINSQGQIVGVSCGDLCHAVLWQDGYMYLLQDLVGAGFPDYLWSARDINDSGQVTGRMYLESGRAVTYVATPVLPLP